jgi:hypothetical protein
MRLPGFRRREVPFGLDQDWSRFDDRKVHYLRRGRHFEVESSVLAKAAKEGGRALGKVPRVVVEDIPRMGYWDSTLYIQYFDTEIPIGDPCTCGSRRLIRNHPQSARCPECGRILLMVEPPPERLMRPDSPDAPDAPTSPAPVAQGLRLARRKDDERFGLREYTQLNWVWHQRKGTLQRYYATAIDPFGMPALIWAEAPVGSGRDPLQAPPHLVSVYRWPAAPFSDLIDVAAIERGDAGEPGRERAERVSKRFESLAPRDPGDDAAEANHRQLDAFSDVRFLVREELPGRERYFGHGFEAWGTPALIWVDYPHSNGARVAVSEDDPSFVHRVYRWPVWQFREVLDLGPLYRD